MTPHFDHAAHVELVWHKLREGGLPAALVGVPAFFRGAATASGHPERYHETMTIGYLLLIADRFDADEPYDAFARRNADLYAHPSILDRYWRPATLASARARERFVFPDALESDVQG